MSWDTNADGVTWDENAEQLIIEEGYQQTDNIPPLVQDDVTQLFDEGNEQLVLEEGYQQSDAAVITASLPDEVTEDWSQASQDFIASSYANVDQPSLVVVEEPWFDNDDEPDNTWFVESAPVVPLPVLLPRQEGDDDSILFLDDSADDRTVEIKVDEWLLPANVIQPTIAVPYLIGMPFAEAFTVVQAVGLVMLTPPATENVIYPFAPEPAGTVIQQTPLAGTLVYAGTNVVVVVSSGLIVYPQSATVNNTNAPNVVIGNDTPP